MARSVRPGWPATSPSTQPGGTGTTRGADRQIRDVEHIAYLDVSPHLRRMIETCWQLGGLEQYEELNMRQCVHTKTTSIPC